MSRLFPFILPIAMGVCAGICVIAVLTMGWYTWQAILLAGALGAAIGIAVARYTMRLIREREAEHHPGNPDGLHPENPHGEVRQHRPPR